MSDWHRIMLLRQEMKLRREPLHREPTGPLIAHPVEVVTCSEVQPAMLPLALLVASKRGTSIRCRLVQTPKAHPNPINKQLHIQFKKPVSFLPKCLVPIKPTLLSRKFSTSSYALQPSHNRIPVLYHRVNKLKLDLSTPFNGTEVPVIPQWTKLNELGSEKVGELLGDSSALQAQQTLPPILQYPERRSDLYEEVKTNTTNATVSRTETVLSKIDEKSLVQLAHDAAAANDFSLLWKVLNYIAKDRWHLFDPPHYQVVMDAIAAKHDFHKLVPQQLVDVFFRHIRHHPRYRTAQMLPTALFFLATLAKIQPIRALRFYQQISADFAEVSSTSFESALISLQMVSRLPYPDLLCDYADKAMTQLATITNELERCVAASKIANSLIQGLITADMPEAAVDVLLSGRYFNLSDPSSTRLFLESYRGVMNRFTKIHVTSVEKLLSLLSFLPKSVAEQVTHRERYEWVLAAHAYTPNQRMSDSDALATLEAMSRVCGITNEACNSYLRIVGRNASQQKAVSAVEKQLEFLFEKFGFLGNANSYSLLISLSQTPLEAMKNFDTACRFGQVDASVYAMLFKHVFAVPRSVIGKPSANAQFRLKSLIEQCQASTLLWTPELLSSALLALEAHYLYKEALDLFQTYAENGETAIDTKSANAAIRASNKLGNSSFWASSMARRMERNLEAWHGLIGNTTPLLGQAVSSSTYAALNAPNSELAKQITQMLPQDTRITLEKLMTDGQPWMLFDERTFNFLSLTIGYSPSLYAKIIAEPFNIIPTSQTYHLLIRKCIRNGKWDGAAFLFLELLRVHPHAVKDTFIDEVLAPLALYNHTELVDSIRTALVKKGVNMPELGELVMRFRTKTTSASL